MTGQEHPCARGLTPECFEAYPEDAKRAFAYRLMHALFPPDITRRLPRIFRPLWYDWAWVWVPWMFLIYDPWEEPEPEREPEPVEPEPPKPPPVEPVEPPPVEPVEPPPVEVVKPEPPKPPITPITPGPPGPPSQKPWPGGGGWNPKRAIPPDWKQGDPEPSPLFKSPIQPAEILQYGPEPSDYVRVWTPGPPHRVFGGPVAAPPFFYDDFDDFTTHYWRKWTGGTSSVEVIGGLLELRAPAPGDVCRCWFTQPIAYPINFEVEFYLTKHDDDTAADLGVEFWTGDYRLQLVFRDGGDLDYYEPLGATRITGAFTPDQPTRWTLVVTDQLYSIYNGETLLKANALIIDHASTIKKIWLQQGSKGVSYFDYISIVAL